MSSAFNREQFLSRVRTGEITAGEMWARRDELEKLAASLLGHMLFEFSRLDVDLGLCLVWVGGGANLDALTKSVVSKALNDKLNDLRVHVEAKLPRGSKRRGAYDTWIDRVDAVRKQRNNLVHGRWGVDAYKDKVVNVIGLPTSAEQQAIEYTLEELADFNEELRALQRELSRLRQHWPL